VSEADWATISIWGWTLLAVAIIVAAALVALIVMAIRYLLARMKREATDARPAGASLAGEPQREAGRDDARYTTRTPSPVPPEDPHAPPSSSAGLTRPGY
jgi:flagellar biosynthesis/type III secretory pathway M-ring protein FliF/YscJ